MIISPDRYGGSRIARHRDGGIWVWGEEYGFIGYQALGRKPQMEQPGQVLRIEYTYFPDSGSRSLEAHENQLFSGSGFNQLVIHGNDSGFQKKRDRGFISGYNRNTAYDFAAGGNETH